MRILTLCSLIVIFASCKSDKTSVAPLEHEKFVDVYIALLENNASFPRWFEDSVRVKPSTAVLDSFGVTEEEFRMTVTSYRKHPKRWNEFFEEVSRKIEERVKREESEPKP